MGIAVRRVSAALNMSASTTTVAGPSNATSPPLDVASGNVAGDRGFKACFSDYATPATPPDFPYGVA